ncbi:hypothetical protein AB0D49_28965 [Streptomyces sp. NPDC048290]|uniref:hypothetical protein n=1 Tax=Streptomyces sp. NPDC048290 TaxID=3155811 RepID=UPI00341A08BC
MPAKMGIRRTEECPDRFRREATRTAPFEQAAAVRRVDRAVERAVVAEPEALGSGTQLFRTLTTSRSGTAVSSRAKVTDKNGRPMLLTYRAYTGR